MSAAAAISLALFAGCGTLEPQRETPEVSYSVNAYNGTQMWLLRNNRLWDNESGPSPSRFAFDLEVFAKGEKTEYLIMIDYYSDEKFFIDSGESLALIVDGERMEFTTGGAFDNSQLVDNVVVRETAYYDMTKKQLGAIANAKKVEVDIKGHVGYISVWFHGDNLASIKKFYDDYVDITQTAKDDKTYK